MASGTNSSSKEIAYNYSDFQYLGRWNDTGSGIWSGWGGTQIVFKVKGASYFTVIADTLDPDGTALENLAVDIDNTSVSATDYYFSTAGAVTNGLASVKVLLPDTGEHAVIMKTNGYNAYIYAQTSKATIKQILLPSEGQFITWTQGSKIIQCVGDSWMGTTGDWPRLMSTTSYKLYPIATGGLSVIDMNNQYNNDYSGHANTTDLTPDAVLISFGVNDLLGGVTQPNFETACGALVDKVRAKHATAPIYLIRVPKNLGTGDDFGKYGTNMANVAAAKTFTQYIDTTSLDATITWTADTYHLTAASKQALADFVKAELVADGIS
jgi:hypothetical protein